ncbi:MAG: hypothetical protein HKN18_04955 [Silicimonas sp.]|nr:hypothetical protein [Silicimonas sp.]
MTRFLAKFIPILVLAACGTALPRGEAVPIQKVLADTRGLNYECVNYDASTDSCEGLARRKVRGDRIYYDASFIFPGPNFDVIRMSMAADFRIEGGRYCGDMSDADIKIEGKLSAGQRSLIEEIMLAEMLSLGEVCGVYYRENGQYVSVTTDRAGRVLPDGVESVRFFKRPKQLRLMP